MCHEASFLHRIRRAAVWAAWLSTTMALAGHGSVVAAAPAPAPVIVDCAKVIGPRACPERYLNNSILHAPPLALADRVVQEYGKPKIMRCWLTLNHMWNRETDACDFNFKLPRRVYEDAHRADLPDGTASAKKAFAYERFEEYLDAMSRNSEEILLNIRSNFEQDVTAGKFTMEKWKELFEKGLRHYKQRCPNLRYVEALNEPEAFAKLSSDQYYPYYQAAYEIVSRLNDELKPAIPLLIGGPCTCSYNKPYLHRFLENYARDANPRKRLDFFSFHDYHNGSRPSIYGEFAGVFREEFQQFGLPGNLPIFMTEVGFGGGRPTPDPERNRIQAAALTTYVHYARQSENLRVFPWVLFHSRNQLCFAQFTQDLTMTPFGAAVRAWSLHKRDEVDAAVEREKAEMGVYAYATLDAAGAAVQVWNYQAPDKKKPLAGPAAAARVAIRNLPDKWKNAKLKVRQFLIDSTHSNCFAQDGKGELQQVRCFELDADRLAPLTVDLEPNAICLWLLDASAKD